jgi:hypothetical protein
VAKQAALELLNSDYRVSDTALSPQQRDAWLAVLEKLERGELKPALEALGYERRPGPLEVLQTVLEARRTGQRPARAKAPSVVKETLEKARSDLRKGQE